MEMYTKKPTIIETTAPDFEERLQYWKRNVLEQEDTLVAKIENPLHFPVSSPSTAQDYAAVMEILITHPYADQLCVHSQSGWIKEYTRRIRPAKLQYLAMMAVRNPFKINYFEIKFKRGDLAAQLKGTQRKDRPVVEFVEYDSGQEKAIVGYQMVLPIEYQELFTFIQTGPKKEFTLIHGMWMPGEEQEKQT